MGVVTEIDLLKELRGDVKASLAEYRDDLKVIRGAVSRISETLAVQGETLKNQHASLEEHMKRSDALEAQVDELRRFYWKVLGATIVLGPLLSAALPWLLKRLFAE